MKKKNSKNNNDNSNVKSRLMIKRIRAIFALLYFVLAAYIINFIVTESNYVMINAYNPRMNQLENKVERGKILDRANEVIAYSSVDENGNQTRIYQYKNMFAHLVGYSFKTKVGIEATENGRLLTEPSSFHKWFNQIKKVKNKGQDVVTTLDIDMQKAIYEWMGNKKGAVLLLEPTTGKIISGVSKPDFDPNLIPSQWESISNNQQKPLLNRISQGLYPPGSTFKIVTALAYLQSHEVGQFSYLCEGVDVFQHDQIQCYNKEPHGVVDMKTAFEVSCNTAFAKVGMESKIEDYEKVTNNLFFNRDLMLGIPYKNSHFKLTNESSIPDIVETAIGQGQTTVTPLHMAMIASAVCNGGIVYEPYLVDHYVDARGKTTDKNLPKKYNDFMTIEEAKILEGFMRGVILNGTAQGINVENVEVYGKTGTAENNKGEDHSWFVGYGKDGQKQVVIVVLLENSGASYTSAVPLANQILNEYFQAQS